MKLDRRDVRFQTPSFPWPGRRRVILHGRDNTMHLLETALVIEGYRQRLFFPVVDRFFQLALSEWTTITVPYSRILRYKHRRRRLLRLGVLLAIWSPVLLMVGVNAVELFAGNATKGLRWFLDTAPALLMVSPALLLLSGLLLYLLRPNSALVYRQADGKRAIVLFRIPSRRRQQAFAALLQRNRDTAKGRLVGDTKQGAAAPRQKGGPR